MILRNMRFDYKHNGELWQTRFPLENRSVCIPKL